MACVTGDGGVGSVGAGRCTGDVARLGGSAWASNTASVSGTPRMCCCWYWWMRPRSRRRWRKPLWTGQGVRMLHCPSSLALQMCGRDLQALAGCARMRVMEAVSVNCR